MSKDTNITVTVNTDTVSQTNIALSVAFSDDRNDPIFIDNPEGFVSIVNKNQKITWTAIALNGRTPITIENVKREVGTEIMEQIGRGNGKNKYKAKIKKDAVDETTENYSVTIGLEGYEGIAGSNENGPLIFVGPKVAYMNSYQNNVWQTFPDAPFGISGITGDNVNGPIVYNGNQISYISMTGTAWNSILAAPFAIEGIAGNNQNGVMVYAGKKVAYMTKYADNAWTTIADAPFEIEGIAGNNSTGPIVYSGNQVAYMNSYSENVWHLATLAPFTIEGIACNNADGPVIYAGNQVAHMNMTQNTWQIIAEAPFIIQGIAGNSVRGPIVYAGSNVVYMSNYNVNSWNSMASIPMDPKIIVIDPQIRVKPNQ
jgi:hypothetical protein